MNTRDRANLPSLSLSLSHFFSEDRERIFLGQSGIFIFLAGRTRGEVGRANFPSSCVHPAASRKAELTKEKSVL